MAEERERPSTEDPAERLEVLVQLESWLEVPMQVLGLVWLAILVLELTGGLSPALIALSTAIWVIFILDFVLRLTLAPGKGAYLRRNWLTLLSLLLPALRVLRLARAVRLLRAARAARGLRLVKLVGSVNRGMRALRRGMGRRGFGYVLALTAVVTFAGAAGMLAFERDAPGTGLGDYATALWWTAMIMTTMGSEYWPLTAEGRVLCILLALYAFGVFGYVTASLASFFIGRDAESPDAEIAGGRAIESLRADIAALAAEMQALRVKGGSLSG
jgi:voltage-gated potassium channel